MNIERREGHFISSGGTTVPDTELFYQSWTSSKSNATLVITHGIAEHSESYAKSAESLAKLGWNVVAWDLRGHGRSEGKRGHVDKFSDYSNDLAKLLAHLKQLGQLERPFALIGHSMGGLVTLRYLIENNNPPQPAAVSLSSPLLGIALEVPAVKELASRVMLRVWPSLTLHNEIRAEDLTRDVAWAKSYEQDPLRHDKISPALYNGMNETMDLVKRSADKIHLPMLVQAAGEERIVSLPAIKAFFPTIGSSEKKLIVYEGNYHEIFNDLDRETVFRDLDQYLRSVMGL